MISGARSAWRRLRPAERTLVLPVLVVLMATPVQAAIASPWLPSRVASHFTGGLPDSSSSLGLIVLVMTLVGVLPLLGWVTLGRLLTLPEPAEVITFAALMTYAVFGVAAVGFGLIAANLGASDWTAARSPEWAQPALVSSLVIGIAVTTVIARRQLRHSGPRPTPTRAFDLNGATDLSHLVWIGHANNPRLAVIVGSGAVAAFLCAAWVHSFAALMLGLVLVMATTMTRVDAVFDGHLVRARIGLVGPWRRIPIQEVEDAEVVEVSPATWFGYGIRWRVGEQAFVVRSGPGLHLSVRSRSALIVSVDDPATAVMLIRHARSGV